MSTKIYTAWQVPIFHLNDFIDYIRPQIFDCAAEKIKELMPEIRNSKLEEMIKENEHLKNVSDEKLRYRFIIKEIEKAAKDCKRTFLFDVDFSLNIWLKDEYAYIIPVDNLIVTLETPDYAKDFSYWDNTDKSDDVSEEEWAHRCDLWNEIASCINHNHRRLCHNVIDFGALYGDYDAELEIKKRIFESNKFGAEDI